MKQSIAILITGLALAAPSVYSAETATPPAAAAGADGAHHAPRFKAHVLDRGELDRLLAQPGKTLIIDVRRPDEISNVGGLPVFLNIQVKDLEQNLAWIPKDRTIVTVSNHAGRAGPAADLLTAKGFKVAGTAGVQLYEQQGGVLTKFPIPAPRPQAAKAQP